MGRVTDNYYFVQSMHVKTGFGKRYREANISTS